MKHTYFLLLPSLFLTLQAPAQTMDRLVDEAKERLEESTGTPLNIELVDESASTARRSGEIRLSRKELEWLLPRFPKDQRQIVLMFIIAHELAHLLQFKNYDIAGRHADAVWLRTLEAQADVLAAKMVGITLLEESAGSASMHAGVKEAALTLFFEMGNERFSLGEHPDREARRYAARLGLDAAFVQWAESHLGRMHGEGSSRTAGIEQLLRIIEPTIPFRSFLRGEQSQYRPEQELEWALRVAKAVTHFEPAAARQLVVSWDSTYWSTSKDYPIGEHSATIENSGVRPVRIYWEPGLVFVRRGDHYNSLFWHRVSFGQMPDEFVLDPGQRRSVDIRIDWLQGFETLPANQRRQYAPGFHMPPDLDALWYAEWADEPPLSRGPSSREVAVAFARPKQESLLDALSSLYNATLLPDLSTYVAAPRTDRRPDRRSTPIVARLGIAVPDGEALAVYNEAGVIIALRARRVFLKKSAAEGFARDVVRVVQMLDSRPTILMNGTAAIFVSHSDSILISVNVWNVLGLSEGAPDEYEVVIDFKKTRQH